MIREHIDCFVPVIQDQREHLIYSLLLDNRFSSNYYFKDRPTFSLSRVEYIDVIPALENLSGLLGRTLFSVTTGSEALVKDTFVINNRQILEIEYKTALYFNNQEDLYIVGQSELALNLVTRYFRKPKQIISNSLLTKRITILKQNKNYLITELKDKLYEFNNVIVIILNRITQRKEIYFVQEDNRTAILI